MSKGKSSAPSLILEILTHCTTQTKVSFSSAPFTFFQQTLFRIPLPLSVSNSVAIPAPPPALSQSQTDPSFYKAQALRAEGRLRNSRPDPRPSHPPPQVSFLVLRVFFTALTGTVELGSQKNWWQCEALSLPDARLGSCASPWGAGH